MTAARPGLTKRDLPIAFMIWGVAFGIFASVQALGRIGDAKQIHPESSLIAISGTVERIAYRQTKSTRIADVTVKNSDGVYVLTSDSWSNAIDGSSLAIGDRVRSETWPNFTTQLNAAWSLQRDGETIVSYNQTLLDRQSKQRSDIRFTEVLAFVSMLLLVAAIVLRLYFGAWSAPRAPGLSTGESH